MASWMQAEGWNSGFEGGTRIALRKLRSIRATLLSDGLVFILRYNATMDLKP